MSTTKVSSYLLKPATNRARHPATMGSSWSCNMFREVNEGSEYLTSVPGLKFKASIGSGKCRGAYVSAVGLSSQNGSENAFVCFGNTVYRIDNTGTPTALGTVATASPRVCFAETGGLRDFLLIADGSNLWAYDLLEGGSLQQVAMPQRVTGDGARNELIAPLWSLKKFCVMNEIDKELGRRCSYQGIRFDR